MAAPWITSAAHFTRPIDMTECVVCGLPPVVKIDGEAHCRDCADRAEENARIEEQSCACGARRRDGEIQCRECQTGDDNDHVLDLYKQRREEGR